MNSISEGEEPIEDDDENAADGGSLGIKGKPIKEFVREVIEVENPEGDDSTESPDFVGEPPKGAPAEDPKGPPSIEPTLLAQPASQKKAARQVIRRTDYKRPDFWHPEDWAPLPIAAKEDQYQKWKRKPGLVPDL